VERLSGAHLLLIHMSKPKKADRRSSASPKTGIAAPTFQQSDGPGPSGRARLRGIAWPMSDALEDDGGISFIAHRSGRFKSRNAPPVFLAHLVVRKPSCAGIAETTIVALRTYRATVERSAILLMTLIGFLIACSTLAGAERSKS
jgi:hypothetical protein